MNKTLIAILIVIAVIALAGGIFFVGTWVARTNAFTPAFGYGYGWNNGGSYGPAARPSGYGMMGGRGYGMMGNRGYGMMGGYGYGWNNGAAANVQPLTVDQAKQAAQKYIQSLNLQGLEIAEVMVFDNNAYVAVRESSTKLGAFELLVDPVTQVAYPEYGADMMWNLKYGGLMHFGMMGGRGYGMMGGWGSSNTTPPNVSPTMTVTPAQAVEYAQKYLDAYNAGATAADDPTQFYGYYTLDYSKDGKVAGMLSVNGFNGQIILHTWHGTFIEEAQ